MVATIAPLQEVGASLEFECRARASLAMISDRRRALRRAESHTTTVWRPRGRASPTRAPPPPHDGPIPHAATTIDRSQRRAAARVNTNKPCARSFTLARADPISMLARLDLVRRTPSTPPNRRVFSRSPSSSSRSNKRPSSPSAHYDMSSAAGRGTAASKMVR
jgi:hypothetical protein